MVALRPDACPRCGDADLRPSRRPRGLAARLLGLRRHRCMSCMTVVWTLSREADRRPGVRPEP